MADATELQSKFDTLSQSTQTLITAVETLTTALNSKQTAVSNNASAAQTAATQAATSAANAAQIALASAQSALQTSFQIYVPDPMRRAVEYATGGKNTVIYDDQGNPNVMVVIPRFNCEDLGLTALNLGTGTHPAFLTNGVARPEILIGKYLASAVGSNTAIIGGATPMTGVSFEEAKVLSTQKGAGWHLMSAWEWAAVALWCIANGTIPRGNTNYGQSHSRKWEVSRRVDGGMPGDSAGTPCTKTGRGPDTWSHCFNGWGIHDLVGNLWEWNDQLNIVDGQIHCSQDNSPASSESSWSSLPVYFDSTSTSGGAPVLSGSIENRMGAIGDDSNSGYFNSVAWGSMTKSASYSSSQLLRRLLIEPVAAVADGSIYTRNFGTRPAMRGGSWNSGSVSGVAALLLSNSRTNKSSAFGFRPAYFPA
ncbi:SUMF1/EgtB/PvdO family nonheme iron enzyme [Pokkaliibacter sp. MBI-7]|uniref:SUMF1/EgtB/PvdO family nonheme iron enzyme n=1 Tax=Pokkaliibacter sp. MBI-7 TaxID=3040600 RepID=UPI0024495DBC|nr:SUMF1/EgtB/PvdO family nonheme iron enzyme [Pokkaliibacter sp. MBI-7]MDH2435579.1 SUMF1/EgtB/PvdO family nonheme iron enzyme [Pokkaliibacter sp. MBI-7]